MDVAVSVVEVKAQQLFPLPRLLLSMSLNHNLLNET